MSYEPPADPPTPAAEPPKPANEPVVRITFPPWLTVDWGKPFAGAFLTVLVGVGLQFLVGLLLPIGEAVISPSSISWTAFARIPPAVWLGFNLGVSPAVIILTGFFWIRLSVRLASRAVDANVGSARNKVLEAAAKFALVYGLLELAIAIVLKQYALTPHLNFSFFTPNIGGGIDPVAAFFYGLLIGFVAGVYLFARSAGARMRDLWPVRFETQVPEVARTTWHGLMTALKIAIPGMMIFMFVATILLLQSEGAPGRIVGAEIPIFLAVMILWTGIDTGFAGLLLAMQLFLGSRAGGIGAFPVGAVHYPSWIYTGIAIPFIALFIAGIRVARDSQSSTPAQAALRGALVGIPLSLVCLIFASLHSIGESGGFIGRAFLVSFLWGGASALGAFFEAAQHTPEQPAAPATS